MTRTPTQSELPKLGRYQVINRIASGGMAEVFLAKAVGAMGFQRLVALKLIHANFTRDPEFVKMFIDEARIAMHLHHRNIVQVFDLDKTNDTYFIAMEFVHGVNLYDLYERLAGNRRWFEIPLALYLVAEVSKGLHFAHTRTGTDGKPLGIIHRDISPQNVLLSFEGEVKITDFGIATAAERLHQTAAGIVKGKYAYMAPERLEEKPVDARVDVFSVGVLLYEMLVGENPFAGPTAVETIENVLSKKIPSPSERGAPVSRRLDDICMKALARDPNQRFRSCQALADAVTEYAMELTYARKDMAAGDTAVAQTLQELFPDKARRAPETAPPRSLSLPVPERRVAGGDTTPDPTGPQAAPQEFAQTNEDLGPATAPVDEDYDAPTILKLSAVDDLPSDEPDLATISSVGLEDSSSRPYDVTGPTELPPGPGKGRHNEDAFASTVPSQSGLPTVQLEPVSPAQIAQARALSSTVRPQPSFSQGGFQAAPYVASASQGRVGQSSDDALVLPIHSQELPSPQPKSKLQWVAVALLILAVAVVGVAVATVRGGDSSASTVSINFTTTPPGATLTVNGQTHPDLTPTQVRVAAEQTVKIQISLSGYESVERVIRPLAGTTPAVAETLVRRTGEISVRATPAEARVLLDGQDKGSGSVVLSRLPLGKVAKIEVQLAGYEPVVQEITLDEAQPRRSLELTLEATGAEVTQRTVLLTAPYQTWVDVYRDGKKLGATPVQVTLPVGAVDLVVKNADAKIDKSLTVQIPKSGPAEIRLTF